MVASLSYRREWQLSSDDKGQTLCAMDGTLSRCGKFDLAAPQKLTGWIPAGTISVSMPSAGYLPAFGFSIIGSFDTVGDRFGIEVPLYFRAGERQAERQHEYFYREGATLSSGFELKETKGVALFIGSSFSLLNGR